MKRIATIAFTILLCCFVCLCNAAAQSKSAKRSGTTTSTHGQTVNVRKLYPVEANGKWGFIDRTGQMVINPQFDLVVNFSEGLARVMLNGKTGYIDRTGRMVINPQFDDGGGFSEGLALVFLNHKQLYTNHEGRAVWNQAEYEARHAPTVAQSNSNGSSSSSSSSSPDVAWRVRWKCYWGSFSTKDVPGSQRWETVYASSSKEAFEKVDRIVRFGSYPNGFTFCEQFKDREGQKALPLVDSASPRRVQ